MIRISAFVMMFVFAIMPCFLHVDKIREEAAGDVETTVTTETTETTTEETSVETTTEPVVTEAETEAETTKVIRRTEFTDVYYDVPLEITMQDLVIMCCKKWGLEPRLVYAVVKVESDFDENCYNNGNYGLMQINIVNHEAYGLDEPFNASQNLAVGIQILGGLWVKYDGDYSKVLMAYNLGEGGASAKWNQGIYTSNYVSKVMSAYENMVEIER